MGRRINISQPTVINTELVPLTDSFALEPNGQTEQWYYENDGTYAPDRRIVPLVITPKLSAFDKDTNQTYSPNISTIAWYASQWVDGRWTNTEITNISDASQDYYIRQDKALQVSKNLSDAAHGVTIRCVATFIDPRDAGITYTEEDTIQLTANKDATVFYPDVDILNETTVTFNPLIEENSHKVFKGKIDWTSITRLNPSIAEYYANPSGTEQMLPDNATNVTSLSPILDIRYGRGATVSWNQLFTYRQTANGTMAGERTLTWNQLVQNGDFSDGLTGWSFDSEYAEYVSISADKLRINLTSPRTILVTHQGTSDYITAGHKYYLSVTCENVGLYTCKIGVSDFIVSLNGQSSMGRHSVVGYPTISSLSDKYVVIEAKTTIGFVTINLDDIMLVDLTLMYGAGNEPSTAAQFESDFQEIFGREIEYEPYNEGETIRISSITDNMASVRRIQGQSVVWNQYVLTTGAGSSERCTFVKNGDNDFTYTKTANNPIGGIVTGTTFLKPQNHTWYTACCVDNTDNNVTIRVSPLIGDAGTTDAFVSVLANSVQRVSAVFPNFTGGITIPMKRFMYYFDADGVLADGASVRMYNFELFDLTLMFGAGNEPETAEEFEAWLAANVGLRDYYPYDGGTILGVKSTGIKTTGFNQWDEEWEIGAYNINTGTKVSDDGCFRSKKLFPVIAGTSYYLKASGARFLWYDKNEKFVDSPFGLADTVYTIPANVHYGAFYKRVSPTTYNHDICINISDPNNNGTYEPYFESTSPMDVTTMKGKLNGQGISTVVFPYGMNGIGDIYDEIYVEDNTLKAVKRIGLRDYESTDSGNDSIITDGTTTCYELATPQEYVLDPTVDARYFEWYGVKNGAEVKIDTLPCYVSGQGTDTLTIDAMFGENIPVVLRAKRYPWSDSLYPSKAYRNMAWRIPNIDAIVASDRGQAVHSDNDGGYEFDTIINIKKAILDEETKNKHLRFKWWMRNTRNNQAVETSVGWGSQVGIGVEDLRNVRGANNSLASTPVYNEVMLLGAYEEVNYTSGNATEYVTYNGVQLFGRTLE